MISCRAIVEDHYNMATKPLKEIKEITLNNIQTGQKEGIVSLFKAWLSENYKVKVNCLDVTDITIEATEDNPIQYEYDINESDIYLHALEDGIKISRGIISNILYSPNQCHHYNPITDYFNNLKGKYVGPSQIDYLFSCLVLKDPNETHIMERVFRKWVYASAACILGKRSNDVVLGLVSDNAGIGKTTFFNEMVPEEMRAYIQIVQRRNNPLLEAELFSNKMMLNFDEFAAITPANENQFKQLVSSETISVQQLGTRSKKLVPRLANCCFTSNKTKEQGGFLRNNDAGMLRRLAILAVEKITDYRDRFNAQQFWAEAVTAVLGGVDYEWNQEDYEMFIKHNRAYVMATNAMKLIQLYYDYPDITEEGDYMSAKDILLDLKKDRRLPSHITNVDEVTLGQALSTLGYKRKMVRMPHVGPRYVYSIKKKP